VNEFVFRAIDRFRYIKIRPETKDLRTKFPEPRAEVYCFRLNFNTSKFVYLSAFVSRFQQLRIRELGKFFGQESDRPPKSESARTPMSPSK